MSRRSIRLCAPVVSVVRMFGCASDMAGKISWSSDSDKDATGTTYFSTNCSSHTASDTCADRHAFSWSPVCVLSILVKYRVI